MNDVTTMRERFEAWARKRFSSALNKDRGEYIEQEVQDAWEAWQAADEAAQAAYGVPSTCIASGGTRNKDMK